MKSILLLILLIPSIVMAEIHKEAQICQESGQICFFWWPELPEVKGWHQDIDHSYHYRMNTQAPENYTFANAEAVIYAKAEYQDKSSKEQTLEEFIAFSQNQFISGAPSELNVTKTGELSSKGKHKFESYSFFPKGEGNWEQVSYAEDHDKDGNKYYVIFVLSSRSKDGYEKNIKAYNEFIAEYQ
ncbi:hypothetical protein [Aurantivibrio infirmus]